MLRTLTLSLLLFSTAALAAPMPRAGTVIGGSGEDPIGVWNELSVMIDIYGLRHGLSTEQIDSFKRQTQLSYSEKTTERRGILRHSLVGRIQLPRCATVSNGNALAFELSSQQSSEIEDMGLMLGSVGEVVGDQVELALVDWAGRCHTD
ncbi:MAG TPA: hypothetical protein PLA94_05255 [Myxococcota bacterium]|nr:hypothetical protein [Myxococcota bacterium]HND29382.1 hypothetical protein [Myxococcota bacterium]